MEPFNLFQIVWIIFWCALLLVLRCMYAMNEIARIHKIIENLKRMFIMLVRDKQNGAFTSELNELAARNYQECCVMTQKYPTIISIYEIIKTGTSGMLSFLSVGILLLSFETRNMLAIFIASLNFFIIVLVIERIIYFICAQKFNKILNLIRSIIAEATLDPVSQLSEQTMPPESILIYERILMHY